MRPPGAQCAAAVKRLTSAWRMGMPWAATRGNWGATATSAATCAASSSGRAVFSAACTTSARLTASLAKEVRSRASSPSDAAGGAGGDAVGRGRGAPAHGQAVARGPVIGQGLQRGLLVALKLAHREPQAGGDLTLGNLLDITMEQDAIGSPGVGLGRGGVGWLERLDGFEQHAAQRGGRIGLARQVQPAARSRTGPGKLGWVIQIQEHAVKLARQR